MNLSVENCSSFENQGDAIEAIGFLFAYVDGARIVDCNASGNVVVSSLNAATGFTLIGQNPGGSCGKIEFLRCQAHRNGNTGFGFSGFGFRIRSFVDNITFRDCIANANGLSTANPGVQAAGFAINTSDEFPVATSIVQNIIFDNCIASGNGLPNPQQNQANSAGILLRTNAIRPAIQNVLVQNCTLNYNRVGLRIPPAGITPVTGIVVKNNEADQNFVSGFDVSGANAPVLVAKNIAYNNGPGGLVNYIGVPAAYIITGTTTIPPPANPSGMLNVAITP